ncbi:MAG: hypothetical protein M3007_02340, partial [Candidatus Eremiobacteraeota bacterium]|nr:hypothetical protein [Candidatus Eremiobacteraeota bacterium]
GLGHRRDADVRKILRLLRRPHLLEKEHLAILLHQIVGGDSARAALLGLIEQTFESGYEAQRLREIVLRCDVHGEKARTAAVAMHLSLRQFFRYRVEAIKAVASKIASLLDGVRCADHDIAFAFMLSATDAAAAREIYARAVRGAVAALPTATREDIVRCAVWSGATTDVDDLCDGDVRLVNTALVERAGFALLVQHTTASAAFERARAALSKVQGAAQEHAMFALTCYETLRARIEGNQSLATSLSAQLRELSGSSESLHALALAEQGYQACLDGMLARAESLVGDAEQLSMLHPQIALCARIALVKATALYLSGNHADAFAYADAATTALSGTQPAYAFLAAALAGRAALLAGKQWRSPDQLCERFPDASLRADIESVRCRHLLRKDVNAARHAALHALDLAQKHGARGGIAFARASLSAVADKLHRGAEARSLRSQAWQEAVSLGDHLLLYDSFTTPVAAVQSLPPITA